MERGLKATHGGELGIGDVAIPCAVLENGWRVLTHQGFMTAIGRTGKEKDRVNGSYHIPSFVAANNLQPYIQAVLTAPTTPVRFNMPKGGIAYGYRAELLPQVCRVYVTAQMEGTLLPHQQHIAQQCQILLMAFATVGIIALVDEATGYKKRPREYAELVDMFVADELQPWVKRFPDDFFKEMCRLRGWKYQCGPLGLPRCVGHDINRFVYDRLPQEVRDELRRLSESRNHSRLHQGLSDNFGVKWLDKHLNEIIALMKAAQDWSMFKWLFKRVYPRSGDQAEFWLAESDNE